MSGSDPLNCPTLRFHRLGPVISRLARSDPVSRPSPPTTSRIHLTCSRSWTSLATSFLIPFTNPTTSPRRTRSLGWFTPSITSAGCIYNRFVTTLIVSVIRARIGVWDAASSNCVVRAGGRYQKRQEASFDEHIAGIFRHQCIANVCRIILGVLLNNMCV